MQCPAPRQIPLSPNINFVYVDYAWTNLKWSGSLLQLSALHEDDKLNLFVEPGDTVIVDKKHKQQLKRLTGLDWDESSLKKEGIEVPPNQILRPLDALEEFLSWLKKRKEVIIMSFDYVYLDSLQLLRMLKAHGLFKKFSDTCLGFIRVASLVEPREMFTKTRLKYLENIPGYTKAKLPDALSIKVLIESKNLTPTECLRYSFDLESLNDFENYKEQIYPKVCTFQPLYSIGVISKNQARRLALGNITLQELVLIFQMEGEDGIAKRLSDISKWSGKGSDFLLALLLRTSIQEDDVKRVCYFFATTPVYEM